MVSNNENVASCPGVLDVLDQHYEKVVKAYDNPDLFFRNPVYEKWMMEESIRQLGLHLSRSCDEDPLLPTPQQTREMMTLVDCGCGNGRFTNSLVDLIESETLMSVCCVGVDAYPEMLAVSETQRNIHRTLCLDAFTFASLSPDIMRYSHIIMKEMIHHLCASNDDLSSYFKNIHGQLEATGTVVIITRPVETDYPFFERIKQIWRTTQPPYDGVAEAMETAGFIVSVQTVELPVKVSKSAWMAFIRNKTWSEFSMCSEAEMEVGLGQLEERFRDQCEVQFNERIIFITGKKETT